MGKKGSKQAPYQRLVDHGESGSSRAPRGYVPMLVGLEKMERFEVHTKFLSHPSMVALLEMAALEFGYEQQGILRIPCEVEYFSQVVDMISKAKQG
ncbi:auxin-responsive protein SAUR71-like protein [Cinnamomum micranthum f. kanehirae]|uniref:Auxin-responsive protein SAUR71-like protein n=1 Tax=Cinnamomum micranthum f. kanehirae TaxID=337451 RepID=A0A443NTQ4_9MAGN|nr:auxin-responsive protein SAUR71-like protein [Cinnamomum micranthum f. kanehirae]